jgi:hypothetical protein
VEGQSLLIQSVQPGQRGQRVHLAGTWNGNELQLFVDGERVETKPINFRLPETSGGLYIGGVRHDLLPPDQNDRFFDGLIYEVRISEGVRFHETFHAPQQLRSDSQTLALYQFDDGHSEKVPDASQNGHDATIVDADWVGN